MTGGVLRVEVVELAKALLHLLSLELVEAQEDRLCVVRVSDLREKSSRDDDLAVAVGKLVEHFADLRRVERKGVADAFDDAEVSSGGSV